MSATVTPTSPSSGRANNRPRGAHRPVSDPRRLAAVAIATLLVAAAAGAVTLFRPTTYTSTATFVLQSDASASQTETLVRNMIALVPDVTVASDLQRATSAPLSATDIAANITVARPPGSAVLSIAYADTDEQRSRDVAAALAPVLSTRVAQLADPSTGAPRFSLAPWGGDEITTSRQSPPVLRNTGLGIVVGLALGLLISVFIAPVERPEQD